MSRAGMQPVGRDDTAAEYREFAEEQTRDSPCFSDWAAGVAADPDVLALLGTLPPGKRQPNLVFAAARWHGAEPGPYAALRRVLVHDWDRVHETVLARATQTNEPGRCATLLPVLARLPGPLALLEVGCSAGLCLFPDRYGYRYETPDGVHEVQPAGGPSPVVLDCVAEEGVPLPDALPEVVWRGGIDLNPLDVRDDDAAAWLETLVWPEHDDRRARLRSAVALARQEPPTLVRGDLLEQLPALADRVPRDATLVVFHSAVAAYLPEPDRVRLQQVVGTLPGHWLSNEGPSVLPGVTAPPPPPPESAVSSATFLLALDGEPVAWTHGHGRAVRWL